MKNHPFFWQVAIPDKSSSKSDLRKTMRRLLREHAHDSAAVCNAVEIWLTANPELETFAVFSALPGEVDLSSVVLNHPEKQWLYPLVREDELTFHAVKNPASELESGSFGILEPAVDSPEIDVRKIDAFFCPGLAFDETGGRLGRGRGFYDRILASIRPDTVKIGICFPFQKVESTFSETHDIAMDRVISGKSFAD